MKGTKKSGKSKIQRICENMFSWRGLEPQYPAFKTEVTTDHYTAGESTVGCERNRTAKPYSFNEKI